MSPLRAEIIRGSLRWLPAAALFALLPKCLVCLAAYAGVGAAIGALLGGPELCGASAAGLSAPTFGVISAASAALGVIASRRFRRPATHGMRARPPSPDLIRRRAGFGP